MNELHEAFLNKKCLVGWHIITRFFVFAKEKARPFGGALEASHSAYSVTTSNMSAHSLLSAS